jgi:intracellular multiplication protein IcmL
MAGEELEIIRLRDDFYRDGFRKIVLILCIIGLSIFFLIATSFFLYAEKPAPIEFATDNEWRVLPPIPIDQPYLQAADLLQWVSNVLPSLFTYNFLNYSARYQNNAQYFTANGWKKTQDLLNIFVDYNTIQNSKSFVQGSAAGAPFILNQGLLSGRYAWWVQMPIDVSYSNLSGGSALSLVLQVLVVRIPTLNNLYGVAIDNVIVVSNSKQTSVEGQVKTNG